MELTQTERHQVRFSGKTSEFFGIWIVNLALSIITLGIYSAWAKVRTNRYFYSHTQVDGHRFRYLAQPLQILIGRLIAATLFVGYVVSANFIPATMPVFLIVFFLVMPWLVNQSVRFGLRMTSYRNIRFSFKGSYGQALVYFGILPIIAAFTFGLAYPWVFKRMDEYIHANISYAKQPLEPELRSSQYYWTAMVVIASVVFVSLIYLAVSLLVMPSMAAVMGDPDPANMGLGAIVFMGLSVSWYLIVFFVAAGVYKARIRNHIYNNSRMDPLAKFESQVPVAGYAFLLATNALAIIASIGLAYPWTKIRKARYLATYTAVYISSSIVDLVDEQAQSESALAEEAAGFFDFEVGVG